MRSNDSTDRAARFASLADALANVTVKSSSVPAARLAAFRPVLVVPRPSSRKGELTQEKPAPKPPVLSVDELDYGWDEPTQPATPVAAAFEMVAMAAVPVSERPPRPAEEPSPEIDVLLENEPDGEDDEGEAETVREPRTLPPPSRRPSKARSLFMRLAMFAVAVAIFIARPYLDRTVAASPAHEPVAAQAASPATAPLPVQPASTPISIDTPGSIGPAAGEPVKAATPPPQAQRDDGAWITIPLPDRD